MMLKKLVTGSLFVALFASAGLRAVGQSSTQGAITGTVVDTTNALVANAAITFHNDGTNAETKVTSDASGFFKEPLLEPGTYTVTVSSDRFQTYIANRVIVQVGQVTRLAPRLALGGASDKVTVTAEAPILNFDSPDFSSNINKRALENIPVNNRRWSSLALLTPGCHGGLERLRPGECSRYQPGPQQHRERRRG
jgi:hypothetical protein